MLRSTGTTLAIGTLSLGALSACSHNEFVGTSDLQPQHAERSQPQAETQVFEQAGFDPFDQPAHSISRDAHLLRAISGRYGDAGAPVIGSDGSVVARRSSVNVGFDSTENMRQISFATEGADFDPAIDRVGDYVYFSSTRHSPTADIYVKTVDGSAVTQLTRHPSHDVMPAVSPDGQRIAFASNRGNSWDIYVMNAEGGQAMQVTSDASHELHPSWSADGTKLTYCRLSPRSDRWEIWVADITKPASRTFVTYGVFPEFHPTEDRILFQRSRERGGRYFAVWTIDYVDGDGVRPTEVASSSTAAIINPTWSSDGQFIACATVVPPDGAISPIVDSGTDHGFADIWIVRADGMGRTNLTGGYSVNTMPTWGPSNELFFTSDRSGIHTIWGIDPTRAIVAAGLEPMTGTTGVADAPVIDDN
jgi:TolB protein